MAEQNIPRRSVLAAGVAVATLSACNKQEPIKGVFGPGATRPVGVSPDRPSLSNPRLIGDGSTADTGPQPNQPTATRLAPGATPPQFVVISWDGAGENRRMPLFERFLEIGRRYNCPQTWFLTGLFLLPSDKRTAYRPPHHKPGASEVNYQRDDEIHRTIELLRTAWLEGHEIGTHFNGHFCGPGGVTDWSVADWLSEIDQAKQFVRTWRTNTGFTDLPSLPFDYEKELVGGRTPCLQGAANLRKAAGQLGWRYDTSRINRQVWPVKDGTLWDLSLQSIPFAHKGGTILSMDYNFMVNQSGGTSGDPAQRPRWRTQTTDSYLAGFEFAYHGNRAPLVIGNHLEGWNGGIYMDAVEDSIKLMAAYPETRFVTFKQLCDWLDAQDPATLAALHKLETAPQGGWAGFGA